MKKTNCMTALMVFLVYTSTVQAQAGKALEQRTIAEALNSWITNAETHVVPLADAMPEDHYSFAPAQTSGEFKGVRTFAQQLKHLAANNYGMAALILGEKRTPEMANETGPDSSRTKAEIMEYLNGSFAALHKAVATIDEENVVQPTTSPSEWQKTRLSFVVDAVAHSFDHYGQLVEYLRMNGIVPPDSRPKKASTVHSRSTESGRQALLPSAPAQSGLKPPSGRSLAPDFNLKDASGKDVKISDLKGKVVLVNFGATWCEGCQVEIPWFVEFQKEYASLGLVVVGISMDDDGWKSIKPWIREKRVNYPIVIGNEALGNQYGLEGMPLTALVDREGRIADLRNGIVEKTATQQKIRDLLQEKFKNSTK